MQNFFIFLTIFTIIFFGIDLIQKFTNHKSKWSRKATHILSGIVVVFFPEFLSSAEIYALTIFFFFFLLVSKWKNILTLHDVSRTTYGELIYPISIFILNYLFLPNDAYAFKIGILVLAFSDGLAGWIGEKIDYQPVFIFQHKKSIGGSMIFFLSTFLIYSSFFGLSLELILPILSVSLALTILEFFVILGFDNLVIPIVAGLLSKLIFINFNILELI
jgi:phytol kinase|tara:strand:- start:2196 stop:2849 length:654 start_codon:yes stop_codon:yes gene_type:complete